VSTAGRFRHSTPGGEEIESCVVCLDASHVQLLSPEIYHVLLASERAAKNPTIGIVGSAGYESSFFVRDYAQSD
jgi:hypothetical protein